MCGLQGIIGSRKDITPETINGVLSHRGPNDSGCYSDEFVFFYHNRLAIQDLSQNAHQPMVSSDDNYVIIFNGEIYNHWGIRKKLETKYSFQSTSDTETLLYGFIEYGKEIVNLLNGIFSFAIYNKQNGEVFIARDPIGVKPLYYFQNNSIIAFASEIKALILLNGFDSTLDSTSFLNNILFLYNQGDSTNYNKVKKLLPGHYIELNVKQPQLFKITKYYEIPFNGSYTPKPEKELIKDLEEQLFKAIERQSIGDVPMGFLLSGGLDSSLLVALTRAIYPEKKLQCFTTGTTNNALEGFQDDYPFAKHLADNLNLKLEVVDSKVDLGHLDTITYHLDEAQTDSAAFHTYSIAERAKQMGFKVLQSGTGADELFSGYRRHQAIRLSNLFKYIPDFTLKGIQKGISILPSNNPVIRRLQKGLKYANSNSLETLFSYYLWLDGGMAQELFTETYKKEFINYNPYQFYKSLLENIPNEVSSLNQMLYWDLKTYLPNNNLNYTDKMGMAHGVEIRVPYLDKELISFACSLPPDLKMKGRTTKYLLRKIGEKYLPEKIMARSKTGFGSPIRQLVKSDCANSIPDLLSEKELNKYQLFKSSEIETLIAFNKSGKIDASHSIFSLLVIQSWLKQFSNRD